MQVFHGPSSDAVTMHQSVRETRIHIAPYYNPKMLIAQPNELMGNLDHKDLWATSDHRIQFKGQTAP